MSEELPRVGFIGLGRMGYPMARHLLDGGVSLTVYYGDPSAMERRLFVTSCSIVRALDALQSH